MKRLPEGKSHVKGNKLAGRVVVSKLSPTGPPTELLYAKDRRKESVTSARIATKERDLRVHLVAGIDEKQSKHAVKTTR
jgi:hypothetical protein